MKGYFDINGDGGSNVVAQVVAKRAQIAKSLAGVRHMLAIGSGKGGVGKSTLTMQIACALRAAEPPRRPRRRPQRVRARLAWPGSAPRRSFPAVTASSCRGRSRGSASCRWASSSRKSQSLDFESFAEATRFVWRRHEGVRVARRFPRRRGVGRAGLPARRFASRRGAHTLQYAEFLGAQTPSCW